MNDSTGFSDLLMLALFLHSAQVVTDLRAVPVKCGLPGVCEPSVFIFTKAVVFFIITDLVEAAVNLKQLIQ